MTTIAIDTENPVIGLKCWSSNEHYNADFDFAFVTATPRLLALITDRRKAFDAALAVSPDLVLIEYSDYSPRYCSYSLINQWDEEGEYQPREEAVSELLNEGECEILRPVSELLNEGECEILRPGFNPWPDEDGGIWRSECDRMRIERDGVSWRCYPKHSDIRIKTASISWGELALLAPQEAA